MEVHATTGLAKRVGHGLREFMQSLRSNWRNNTRSGALSLFLSLSPHKPAKKRVELPAFLYSGPPPPRRGCLIGFATVRWRKATRFLAAVRYKGRQAILLFTDSSPSLRSSQSQDDCMICAMYWWIWLLQNPSHHRSSPPPLPEEFGPVPYSKTRHVYTYVNSCCWTGT